MLIAQKVDKLVLSHGFGKEKRLMEGFRHGPSLSSYENGDWISESKMAEAHRGHFGHEDCLMLVTRQPDNSE